MGRTKMSIILNEDCCIRCGKTQNLHVHHVFYGTANRKCSDEDGCVIKLCSTCHSAVHNPRNEVDREFAEAIKKIVQKIWMDTYKKSTEDFIKRYGKSYL